MSTEWILLVSFIEHMVTITMKKEFMYR